jgi:hypothetical protein
MRCDHVLSVLWVALCSSCSSDADKNAPPDAAGVGSDACSGSGCQPVEAGTDSASAAPPTLCPRTGGALSPDAGPLPDGVQIVSGPLPGGVFGMAADDSNVYWANGQTIHRIALAGGADTTLFDQTSSVTGTLDGLALPSRARHASGVPGAGNRVQVTMGRYVGG